MNRTGPLSGRGVAGADAEVRAGEDLIRQGRHQEAVLAFQRALGKAPGHLDALVGLGAALALLNRVEEAERYCRNALAIRADQPAALRTLAGMLQLQGRYADAIRIADDALAIQPGLGEAWLARADSLANQGLLEGALEGYGMAARSVESAFDAKVRSGMMLGALGRPQAAFEAFDAAIALRPDAPVPRFQRGLLRLQLRDFAAGWDDYEARWRSERFVAASRGPVPLPLVPHLATGLSAAGLAGKKVLVVGEQGIGDQLMFASMIPDLARTAASVVCVCEPRLVRLFSASFETVAISDPNVGAVDADLLMAMGSLGAAFRREARDFPGTPYLRPRPETLQRWSARLGPRRARLRIGVSWRGGTPATRQHARSLSLAQLAPILDLPDCEFVNLQYGDVSAEIAAANAGRQDPIRVFAAEEIDDFEDLAALTANLDAVISVQTAIVHLSGALGQTCLALLPHRPEWRYMQSGATMPWYSSVRLLRQAEPDAWEPVIAEAAAALRALPARAL